MAYTAGNLISIGNASGWTQYFYNAGSDGVATVNAAGYFNNTDDKLNMVVGDEIVAKCDDATVVLTVKSISSGAVTTEIEDSSINVEAASTAVNVKATGLSLLSATAAKTYTMDAPFKGALKVLFQDSSVTLVQKVSTGSTAVTYNGAADEASFNAAGECLVLVGTSPTRWVVLANTGSVGIA